MDRDQELDHGDLTQDDFDNAPEPELEDDDE
jgi:hypothetical protein